MDRIIFPDNLRGPVTAFFTGKSPGADPVSIGRIMKISKENIFFPIQKHTDRILVLESPWEPEIADAVITVEKGILIGVQAADCVPILLYEHERGICSAIHAGWRGTAEGILKKTIQMLIDRYVIVPQNILIALGPSIRWCCYHVSRDVIDSVKRATGEGGYAIKKGHQYCLDLASANRYQALSMGVPKPNIWISEDCTFCYPDRYYSYRYTRGLTGRQGGFIGLMEQA